MYRLSQTGALLDDRMGGLGDEVTYAVPSGWWAGGNLRASMSTIASRTSQEVGQSVVVKKVAWRGLPNPSTVTVTFETGKGPMKTYSEPSAFSWWGNLAKGTVIGTAKDIATGTGAAKGGLIGKGGLVGKGGLLTAEGLKDRFGGLTKGLAGGAALLVLGGVALLFILKK